MLAVVTPSTDALLEQQEQDRALYFSKAAEDVLRREGLISATGLTLDTISNGPADPAYLFTRSVAPTPHHFALLQGRPLAFEGPLSKPVLDWLGLSASGRKVDRLAVAKSNNAVAWNVFRPSAETGKPPKEVTLPRIWNNRVIEVQLFEGIAPEDTVLFMTLPDGTKAPAVFIHNGVWIAAFPVFDLLGEHFTFPPLSARYVTRRRGQFDSLGRFVCDGLAAFLVDRNITVVRAERWPQGVRAAFTMRHDYDRALSEIEHASLMDLYRHNGVKCSMGYLGYLLPQKKIRDLVANGHEVQIHLFEHDAAALAAAVHHLSGVAGTPVIGATIHGGASSLGFRGDIQFDWLERAGIRYTENFSVGNYPAPIYRPDALGVPRRSGMLTTPMHFSLDISMNKGEHRLEAVRTAVGKTLESGHMAVAMNHPDLNREELTSLVESLPRDGVWFATLAEVCEWERCTKYEPMVNISGQRLSVAFRQELPRDAVLTVQRAGAAAQKIVVPAGSRVLHLDAQGNVRFRAVAQVERPPLATLTRQALLRQGRLRKLLLMLRGIYRGVTGGKGPALPALKAALFSRVGGRLLSDAVSAGVRPLSRIVLQGADSAQGELDFLALMDDEAFFDGTEIVIGCSISGELHPVVVAALANLVAQHTSVLLDGDGIRQTPLPPDKSVLHLASWIAAEAKGERELPREELGYFLASTALRARAMRNILRAHGPERIDILVDHGSGVGLMPWLLSREPSWVGRSLIVEPSRKYHPSLEALWDAPDQPAYACFSATTEMFDYPFPADAILFCHSLFRVKAEDRTMLLNRAWKALRPGGCIVVNEVFTDDISTGNEKNYVNRAEIAEVMSWERAPVLFRMENDWNVPEDPMAPALVSVGSTGFLVARKALLANIDAMAGDVADG